jgi:hypothetical protein
MNLPFLFKLTTTSAWSVLVVGFCQVCECENSSRTDSLVLGSSPANDNSAVAAERSPSTPSEQLAAEFEDPGWNAQARAGGVVLIDTGAAPL